MKRGIALKEYPLEIESLRMTRVGDTYRVYIQDVSMEWKEIYAVTMLGNFDMVIPIQEIKEILSLQDKPKLKVKLLMCQAAIDDTCNHREYHEDCKHGKPHKRIRTHCKGGYDIHPDQDYCCPSCIVIDQEDSDNPDSFISEKEMVL